MSVFAAKACLFALPLLLLSSGCDAGYSYRPDGWSISNGGHEWTKVDDGVSFLTWGIGGLVGSEDIIPEFEIRNATTTPVIVESAVLLARGKIYDAQLPGKGELQWRTVLPGEVKRITLYWHLEEVALKSMGEKPEIDLRVRRGVKLDTMKIKFSRVD